MTSWAAWRTRAVGASECVSVHGVCVRCSAVGYSVHAFANVLAGCSACDKEGPRGSLGCRTAAGVKCIYGPHRMMCSFVGHRHHPACRFMHACLCSLLFCQHVFSVFRVVACGCSACAAVRHGHCLRHVDWAQQANCRRAVDTLCGHSPHGHCCRAVGRPPSRST